MTAPNTITNESQQQQPVSTDGNGNEAPPTPPTPPTNPQPPSPTERPGVDEYTRALQDQLRIVTQQNLDLQRERENRQAAPPNPQPAVSNEEFRQNFYNDPKKVFDEFGNRLLNDIKETIRPFESFIREGRSVNAYETAKNKLRNNSQFAAHWDHNVDTTLDFLVRSATQLGQAVNEDSIFNMVTAIIGQKAVGMLPQFMAKYGLPYQHTQPQPPNPNPTPTPDVNNNQLPPNLPPRPPTPAPSSGRSRADREPNENERRIMRENGFATVDEYDFWLQVPSNQVADAKYPGKGKW